MDSLQIFIASPNDVERERTIAMRIVEQLRIDFRGRAKIDLVDWKRESIQATDSYQTQIPSASASDIVVVIFWSKLGTPLPDDKVRSDGTRYESGTVYELETALAASSRGGPAVYVYRKLADLMVDIGKQDAAARLTQKHLLDSYIAKWFGPGPQGEAIRACHGFKDEQDFVMRLDSHLRSSVAAFLDKRREKRYENFGWRGPPYLGLRAFEFEHAPVFRGRQSAVGQILAALKEKPTCAFVLVVGMSGSGKSSVVRAGVIPALYRQEASNPRGLARAVFRPSDCGANPFEAVAEAIGNPTAVPSVREADRSGATLANCLEADPLGTATIVIRELRRNRQRMVLFVDQLEEVFTHIEIADSARSKLLEFLEALALSGDVSVIAALRSDYLPQAIEEPILKRLKFGAGQVELAAPTPAEIGEMIRLPAADVGAVFEERNGKRLDEVLLDEAAKNPRALPLLEFTLEQLWEKSGKEAIMRFSDYDKLGGLAGSIAAKAEATFDALTAESRASLGRVLSALTSIDPANNNRCGRRHLAIDAFATDSAASELIDAFVRERLFTAETQPSGRRTVTLTHEALLSEWDRARSWLSENWDFVQSRSRVSQAAESWARDGRSKEAVPFEGRALEEARTVRTRADHHEIELEAVEAEYVDASIRRARARAWGRRGIVVGFAVLATIASVMAYLSDRSLDLATSANARTQVALEKSRSSEVTAKTTIGFIVKMFERMTPRFARGEDVPIQTALEEGERSVEADLRNQPLVRARVLRTVAEVYSATGDNERAVKILSALLPTIPVLVDSWEERAAAHRALADAYFLSQMDEDAAKEYRLAIEISQSEGPRDSEVLADSLAGLSEVAEEEESGALINRALAMYTALYGKDDMRVLRARHTISYQLVRFEEFAKAIPELEQVRNDLIRVTEGAYSPDVAEVTNSLAAANWGTGNLASAAQLYSEVLKTYESVYEKDDTELANALHSLGRVEFEGCDLGNARAHLFAASRILDARLPRPRPIKALAHANLGLVWLRAGKIDEASREFTRSRDIARLDRTKIDEALRATIAAGSMAPTAAMVSAKVQTMMAIAEASALSGLAEISMIRGDMSAARISIDEAKSLLERRELQDNWRYRVLLNTEALLLAGKNPDDAGKLLSDNLTAFAEQWPEGSVFTQIAAERLTRLGRAPPAGIPLGCPKSLGGVPTSVSVSR